MVAEPAVAELAARVLDGKVPAVARAISWAESGDARFPELLRILHPRTGRARVVGLTGSPGAGKSTLTAALARLARAEGKRVGIVAVDPSSPFSGGAILGDRIRMQDLYTDPGVLIRSMATRGHLGGLARASADAVDVLDAAGYDEVLVETLGVGQDEVEVFRLAESCVVMLTPGMGDDIQAIKAGLMEVADLFVVNKADREGADRVVQEILQMLELGEHGAWVPPVLKTVARSGDGVPEVRAALERHRAFLEGEDGAARRRGRTRQRIEAIVRERLLGDLRSLSGSERSLDAHADRVEARTEDPVAAADALLSALRSRRTGAAGVVRIAHLGIAVPRVDAARFYDVLGLAETHREEVASQGVVTSFRPVGESFVELLEPAGVESPIAKFLERHGPGLHHVCLEVTDIRAALAMLKEAGMRLVNEEPVAGAHGCLVAFIHPSAAGGVLFELSERVSGAER
ncbi:MAG TPA: methylmalonyl Co-A mutase-associated GTPase MeaB [Thermoanaerobaculia bacterium]|nr:methylmalonyl Co-A mutase-associated GTPase MeaB [Thermoanaerobaculia bacterium]